MRARLFFLAYLFASPSFATTITEDFSTLTKASVSENFAVWNPALGYVHPTLFITLVEDQLGNILADQNYSVGDGSDGAFNLTTYERFSTGGDLSGNIIRLNTDSWTELKVTEFRLEAGWTLQPTGTNALVIKSLSDVVVDGTIDCGGGNGGDLNADTTVLSSGGIGRCGGKNGGNGETFGAAATVATRGDSSNGVTVSGGHPGTTTGAGGGDGGGGGGAYGDSTPALPGVRPRGGGNSAAGDDVNEPKFDELLIGGSGGGGGAAFGPGANESNGGGGGGGGGVVLIYVVRNFSVGATGRISVDGGRGGDGVAGLNGGGGGGGGGGSILVWGGGNYTISGANIVTANNGRGGVTDGGDGGRGAIGRTWVTVRGAYTGFSEIPTSGLNYSGDIKYQTGDQDVFTTIYDLQNTKPTLTSVSASSSGAGAVRIEVAGSNDSFINDDSGWVPSTSLSDLNGKRFLRFRVIGNSTDVDNPLLIQSFALDYEGGLTNQFNFIASCGRIGNNDFSGLLNFAVLVALLAFGRFLFLALQKRSLNY